MSNTPETIKDIAKETLIDAIETAKSAGTWLAKEIPDVLQQLITFHIAENIAMILMLSAIIFGCYKLISKFGADKDGFGDLRSHSVFLWVFGSIAVGFCCIGVMFNVIELLKLTLAPKVWLLEYGASLIRNAN